MTYLLQHLENEAKRAVQCFLNDKVGYIMALKRLKYMLGQKTRICQVYIQMMTRGKDIGNDDNKNLMEYYFTISDCIVAPDPLKHAPNLFSSDILRQVIRRLSPKIHGKWQELCFTLRRTKESRRKDLKIGFKTEYWHLKKDIFQ